MLKGPGLKYILPMCHDLGMIMYHNQPNGQATTEIASVEMLTAGAWKENNKFTADPIMVKTNPKVHMRKVF